MLLAREVEGEKVRIELARLKGMQFGRSCEQLDAAACTCPDCGGVLNSIGADVAEIIEGIPARFKVIRHVRPKFACEYCHSIVQAPAPSRPIARGLAGRGFLAHALCPSYLSTSKKESKHCFTSVLDTKQVNS